MIETENSSKTNIDDVSFIEEFNSKMKKLYADYNKAINEKKYEYAIKIGKDILRDLLKIAKEQLISNLRSLEIRKIVEDIINYHEKNLGYVEGIEEAMRNVPLIYSYEIKERALATLSSSIQELFSFILGALMIITDINSNFPNERINMKENFKETFNFI